MSKAACFLPCSFAPLSRRGGLSRSALVPAFFLAHVTPIKADKNEEIFMTIINLALLLNALANFFSALARCIAAFRRRRRHVNR
ncbi:MAG TPA: hypothetical protein VG347_09260 [Verrucomicrobiae bacterium]|nr:hypothetical protein [Verrucomicrobiae bacterium]